MTRNNLTNNILTWKNICKKTLRLLLVYLANNNCVKDNANEIDKRIFQIKKEPASIIMLIFFHLIFKNM